MDRTERGVHTGAQPSHEQRNVLPSRKRKAAGAHGRVWSPGGGARPPLPSGHATSADPIVRTNGGTRARRAEQRRKRTCVATSQSTTRHAQARPGTERGFGARAGEKDKGPTDTACGASTGAGKAAPAVHAATPQTIGGSPSNQRAHRTCARRKTCTRCKSAARGRARGGGRGVGPRVRCVFAAPPACGRAFAPRRHAVNKRRRRAQGLAPTGDNRA